MIVCKECGFRNEDDEEFCGNCRKYLPHVGEHVPDEAPAQPDDEVVEEDTPPEGFVSRVLHRFTGDDASAPPGGPGGVATAVAPPVDGAVPVTDRTAGGEAPTPARSEQELEAEEQRARLVAAEQERRDADARARDAATAHEEAAARIAELARAEEEAAARLTEQGTAGKAPEPPAEAVDASGPSTSPAVTIPPAEPTTTSAATEAAGAAPTVDDASVGAAAERPVSPDEEEAAQRDAAEALEEARRAREEAEAAAIATEHAAAQAAEEARKKQEREEIERRKQQLVAPAAAPPPTPPVTPPPAGKPDDRAVPTREDSAATDPAVESTARAPEKAQTRKKRRAKQQPKPQVPVQPGDLVCGNCGYPNTPNRKFCGKCAASLADVPPARVPWWRRLRRRKEAPDAGQRPKGTAKSQSMRDRKFRAQKLLRMTLALAVLAVFALSFLGPLRDPVLGRIEGAWVWFQNQFFSEFVVVNPSGADANAALDDHIADEAMRHTNTYWAATWDGNPRQLIFDFEEPVDLSRVLIHNGANEDEFDAHLRVRSGTMRFLPDGTEIPIELDDIVEPQEFAFDARGVTSVEFTIERVYPLETSDIVAVRVVEFFTTRTPTDAPSG